MKRCDYGCTKDLPTEKLCPWCREERFTETVTVKDIQEALDKAAPGADELNEQLRNAALQVDMNLRLR